MDFLNLIVSFWLNRSVVLETYVGRYCQDMVWSREQKHKFAVCHNRLINAGIFDGQWQGNVNLKVQNGTYFAGEK